MKEPTISELTGWKVRNLPIGDIYIDPGNHGYPDDREPLVTVASLKAKEGK